MDVSAFCQLIKRSVFLLIYALPLFLFSSLQAQTTKTFTAATGTWSTPSNWSPSGVPSSIDRVIINAGTAVTVDGNYTCDSIYFASGNTASSIVISGTNTLTATKGIQFSNPTANITQLINVGAGSLTCNVLNLPNINNNRVNRITVSSGTVTVNTDFSSLGSTTENIVEFTGAGKFRLGGTWTSATGTFTNGTSAFEYFGASAQSIRSRTYNKLILSGGSKTPGGSIIVNDSLIINAGATLNNSGAASLTLNSVFYIAGTYIEGSTSGTVTLVGQVNIAPTGTFQATVGEAFTIRGGMRNDGTFASGTGTYTFATNNQSLIGSKNFVFLGALTVTGITLTNTDSVQVNGNFTGTGTFDNTAGSYLLLNGGTNSITTLVTTGAGNIVEYGRAGTQTIIGQAYQVLRLSGAGTKTAGANITVNENLYVDAASTMAMSTFSLSFGVNCLNSGTGILTTANVSATPIPAKVNWSFGTINYNSASSQSIVSGTYKNLTSSSVARVLSSTDTIYITGTFTPGSGTYTTTSSVINLSSSSTQNVPNVTGGYNVLMLTGGNTKTATANITVNGTLHVPSGNTFNLSTFTLAGASLINTGTGTLITASTSGTALPTGRSWTNSVIYQSASAQTLINGTYQNLDLQSAGNKSANGAVTVNGILSIANGVTMVMGTNQLSGTISSTSGTGTLSTANTGTTPIPSGRTWSFVVNYLSTALQTIVAGNYTDLTASGGSRTLASSGTIGISGVFTPGAGTYTVTGSTVDFNGSGAQTIPAMTFNNLISSNTGARTLSSGTITVSGNYTGGASNSYTVTGNTVTMNGTSQTITGVFNNLNLSTAGTKTATGNINIAGTLTVVNGATLDMSTAGVLSGTLATISNSGTIKTSVPTTTSTTPIPSGRTWGGTIEYAGSAAQTAVPGTFNNLTLSGAGGAKASGDITVNNILSLGANPNGSQGILEMTAAYGSYATVNNTNSTSIYNDLNSSVLIMGPSATTTGSGDVTGKIRRTSFTSGTTYTFGNTNTQLTFTGTSLPSQITVVATRGNNGLHVDKSNSVRRMYQVLRTGGNTPTTMTIRFAYDDSELNGNSESNLVLWDHHLPYAGLTPHEHGKTNQNTTQNWVELSSHGILYLATEGDAAFTKYWMISNKISTDTMWLGAVPGGSWTVASNWNSGTIPSTTTKIVVPDSSTTPNDPIISGSISIGTLEIKANGYVNGSSGTLTLTGGPAINGGAGTWLNNGSFNAGTGTVIFDNSDATIAGTTTFNNLTINTGKKATMQNGAYIKVNGTLTNSGTLDAASNPNTIEFGGTSQTITNLNGTIPGYSSLILSGTSPTLPSTLDISGNLTLNTTTSFTGNTLVMRGTGAQAINGTQSPTLNNLTINNTGNVVTMANNHVINGTLTFTNGKLDVTGKSMTINGSVVNNISAGLRTGSGTILTLNNNVARTLSFDQTTPGTTNLASELINNSSSQTTTLGNQLRISSAVTPTSGTINANGNLVLLSDANGTALVKQGTGNYITGNVTVQRYIPAVARRFRFMSSPVSGATLADWKNEFYITGTGGAANGFDETLTNASTVFSYSESVPGNSNAGWIDAPNINLSLGVAQGYRVFIRGDRSDPNRIADNYIPQNAVTADVTGPVNKGDIVAPISFTNNGNGTNDGWNLIGNPYPCPYDWNAFYDNGTNYNNIESTIYIYDPNINGYKSYNAASDVGDITNGIIPSGSGFFVRTSGPSPSLTFKEAFKVYSTPTMVFKTFNSNAGLRIQFTKDSITSDAAFIKYIDKAQDELDAFDIQKLAGAVNITSVTDSGLYLTANCKPLPESNTDTIPLNIGTSANGTYKFSFSNVEEFMPDQPVSLVDRYTGTKIDLKKQTEYTFDVDTKNTSTLGKDRFMVVVGELTDTTTTGLIDVVANNQPMSVYPSLADKEITVKLTNGKQANSIEVVDLSGKVVMTYQPTGIVDYKLDISNLPAGMYFVRTYFNRSQSTAVQRFVKP